MNLLQTKEVQLWRNNSSFKDSWKRQFLNIDYTKVEVKRRNDVLEWWKKFHKAKTNEILDEVCFYVIPIKPSSELKASVAIKGLKFVQLSALRTDIQFPLILLFPFDKISPEEHSLIRLIKPRKTILETPDNNQREYAVYVEDFVKEPVENIYKGINYEPKRIGKFFSENLIGDKKIVQSFQSSISGSPHIMNDKGGITFSNFFKGESSFDENFLLTLKQMQPPEFTDIQRYYPPSLIQDRVIKEMGGFGSSLLFSEKYVNGSILYSAFPSNRYSQLNNELSLRKNFKEYSLFSPFNFSGESQSEMAHNVFSKLVKTEVTGAVKFSDIYGSDVDLERAKRNINVDLLIQVASQKFLEPKIVDQESRLKSLRLSLKNDWTGIFESLGIKRNDIPELEPYSKKSFENILSVAKSFARDEGTENVTDNNLNQAYKLFTINTEEFIENTGIKGEIEKIPERYMDKKIRILLAELGTESNLTINELFEKVKEHFKDLFELQKIVDKLEEEGRVYQQRDGYYSLI